MEDKTKLFVFDKKEIALLFLFVVFSAATSFIFGVKVGKNYSYESAGLSPADRIEVDLRSREEEEVSKTMQDLQGAEKKAEVPSATLKKLESEFERIDEEIQGGGSTQLDTKSEMDSLPTSDEAYKKQLELEGGSLEQAPANTAGNLEERLDQAPKESQRSQYLGKFTIQLGSYPNLEDAKQFADTFRIRGYNPIVNQVDIKSRGTWYRVSLGVFDTAAQAKSYILKEETLFRNLDYVVTDFK
jgi:cell division septation protein DedD